MPAEEGFNSEAVRVRSETSHSATANGSYDRTVTELLTRVDITHMDFNNRSRNCSDCIGNGI